MFYHRSFPERVFRQDLFDGAELSVEPDIITTEKKMKNCLNMERSFVAEAYLRYRLFCTRPPVVKDFPVSPFSMAQRRPGWGKTAS